MDPNAAHKKMVDALATFYSSNQLVTATPDIAPEHRYFVDVDRYWASLDLLESADALDCWLKTGGFLPDAWSQRLNDAEEIELTERVNEAHQMFGHIPPEICDLLREILKDQRNRRLVLTKLREYTS